MHGRNNKERLDSVTVDMLRDRQRHAERFEEFTVPKDLFQYLDKNGFGTKKKMNGVYAKLTERQKIDAFIKGHKNNTTILSAKDELVMTSTAAQGFSVQVSVHNGFFYLVV